MNASRPPPTLPAFNLLVICTSLPRSGHGYLEENTHSAGDQLLAEIEAHQDQTIVNQTDHERAHDGPDDRTETSKQACAPEHSRGDDREFITFTKLETTGSQTSGVEHPGKRCGETRDDQHLHFDITRLDSGKSCRSLASASLQHLSPEACFAKD